jgi:hypothetical protein|tara:strand:+ start:1422 stop:1994 length:573 start_codon:yes stop_codon:yes gene_type:complete
MIIQPYLHKVICSSCGALITLPIDIVQTNVLSNTSYIFKPNEFKYMFLMINVFSIQNYIFDIINYINNNAIKGFICGFTISPIVIYLKIKKYYLRFNSYPIYKNFIFIYTLREMLFYSILYSLYYSNIPYIKLYASLLTNIFIFPIKIIALKYSYLFLVINKNSIIKSSFIEILKSAIGDSIALNLINMK